ncbi:MAG: GPR endopeptidase [Clostridia bacterium]|nr:GPR endopeptidase [Clostridia bacterium]
MWKQRTDLVLERQESADAGALAGVKSSVRRQGPLKITDITVLDERGAKALEKPPGRYLTAELPAGAAERRENLFACAEALAALLRPLLPGTGAVLAAGLGNRAVTPDALGPETISNLIVTRHLIAAMPETFGGMRPVCAVACGVLGDTGVETGELLRGVVERVKPAAVVAVDALCARSLDRLCRAFQFSDTGIVPGSGAFNPRKALNEATLGVPVVALGVPTVVEARTLCADLVEGNSPACPLPREGLLVTPKDIDRQIALCGKILGYALNLALQRDMTAAEMESYLE